MLPKEAKQVALSTTVSRQWRVTFTVLQDSQSACQVVPKLTKRLYDQLLEPVITFTSVGMAISEFQDVPMAAEISKINPAAYTWTSLHLDKPTSGQAYTWTSLNLDNPAPGQSCTWTILYLDKPKPGQTYINKPAPLPDTLLYSQHWSSIKQFCLGRQICCRN